MLTSQNVFKSYLYRWFFPVNIIYFPLSWQNNFYFIMYLSTYKIVCVDLQIPLMVNRHLHDETHTE